MPQPKSSQPSWSIHHVNLPSHDVRRSAAFFRDIVGMEEGVFELTKEGKRGKFDHDPDSLAAFGPDNRGLHIVRPQPTFARDNDLLHNPTFGGHVAITVRDLQAVMRRLDAAGIPYSDAGQYAMAGIHNIYVWDPSNNLVEINKVV